MNKTDKLNVKHILLAIAALAVTVSVIFAVLTPGLSVRAEDGTTYEEPTVTDTDTDTETEPETETDTETETETETETDTETDTETVTDTDTDTDTETDTDTDTDTETVTDTDTVTEAFLAEIKFVTESLKLAPGESAELVIVAVMSDGTETEAPAVTFSSSNDEIASVDEAGTVTAVANGKITITASNEDGSLTCECTVLVSLTTVKLQTVEGTGEKIATGFAPGTSVTDATASISESEGVDPEAITVKNTAGEPVKGSDNMATGYILSIDGTEYTVIIYGDTDGDGIINSNDVKAILDYLTGASRLLDENRADYLAAQVLDNSDITIENALYLQRYVYGLETITQ